MSTDQNGWITVDHSSKSKKNRKSAANLDATYTVAKKTGDNSRQAHNSQPKSQQQKAPKDKNNVHQQHHQQPHQASKGKRSTNSETAQNGNVKSSNLKTSNAPKTVDKSTDWPKEEKKKGQAKSQQKGQSEKKASASEDNKVKKAKSSGKVTKKMGSRRLPWTLLVTILIAASASWYDIHLHGSFNKSITGQTLAKYGVLDFADQLLLDLNRYTQLAKAWAAKNVPVYYQATVKFVSPYYKTARDQLEVAFLYLWQALLPVRQWVSTNIPPLIKHVQEKYLPAIITFVNDFSLAVVAILVEMGKWIQANVLTDSLSTENLYRVSGDALSKVQVATGDIVSWISRQYQALTQRS